MHVLHRWSKPGCLEVAISAHPTQHSLLQLTGLPSPPQAVLSTTAAGDMLTLPEVHSAGELRASSVGGYVTVRLTGDCYTMYVRPGDGGLGSALRVLL